ncbi:hypothetical protein BDR22DRAFT_272263 [Usnea florida]
MVDRSPTRTIPSPKDHHRQTTPFPFRPNVISSHILHLTPPILIVLTYILPRMVSMKLGVRPECKKTEDRPGDALLDPRYLGERMRRIGILGEAVERGRGDGRLCFFLLYSFSRGVSLVVFVG